MAYALEGARARPAARQRPRTETDPHRLISTPRARLRLALLSCIATAGLFGFVLFPVQRLAVTADGASIELKSRDASTAGLLALAGVQAEAGDVVVRSPQGLQVARAVPVTVEVDGRTVGWRTRSATVLGLLDELGIELVPRDSVRYNGDDALRETALPVDASARPAAAQAEPVLISVQRAVPFTVVEDGRVLSLRSSKPTLATAFEEAGIELGPADQVSVPPAAALVAGMAIEVKHAKALRLRLGDRTSLIYTQKTSLGEALAEAGYALGAEDRVEPSIEAAVTNNMTARLVRVVGRSFFEREPVKRRTVFRPDESLSGSQTRTVPGSDGVRVHEYRVVIEDGVEREKKLVGEYMEPEAKDSVIYYAATAANEAGQALGELSVARTERVHATWYNAASAGRPPTDPWYGITASGRPVTHGIVAVDPDLIAMGTRLYIPGYGFGLAADTGSAIKGHMIDLGYPDGVQVSWRTGWVEIYILAP